MALPDETICGKVGCTKLPVGLPRIVLYALRGSPPLTQIVLGLCLCEEHLKNAVPDDVMTDELFENMRKVLLRSGRLAPIRALTPVDSVALDSDEAKVLREK